MRGSSSQWLNSHLVLRHSANNQWANHPRQGTHTIRDTHQDTGISWSDVQVIDIKAWWRKKQNTNWIYCCSLIPSWSMTWPGSQTLMWNRGKHQAFEYEVIKATEAGHSCGSKQHKWWPSCCRNRQQLATNPPPLPPPPPLRVAEWVSVLTSRLTLPAWRVPPRQLALNY